MRSPRQTNDENGQARIFAVAAGSTHLPMTPEFERLFSWGGTPQAMCGCGRVHYASGGDFMEVGELADLESKRKGKPDRYIPTTDDSVGITDVFGVTYVWDCPCGWAENMERHLWSRRREIIAYYHARTQRELQEATENAAALAGVSNVAGEPQPPKN